MEQLRSSLNTAPTEAWAFILQCGTHLGELIIFHSPSITIKDYTKRVHAVHALKNLQEAVCKQAFFLCDISIVADDDICVHFCLPNTNVIAATVCSKPI